MLFDVRLNGAYDGYATYHTAVVVPMPIKQFKLKLPTAATSTVVGDPSEMPCELCKLMELINYKK